MPSTTTTPGATTPDNTTTPNTTTPSTTTPDNTTQPPQDNTPPQSSSANTTSNDQAAGTSTGTHVISDMDNNNSNKGANQGTLPQTSSLLPLLGMLGMGSAGFGFWNLRK
jgi:hypothetical protein